MTIARAIELKHNPGLISALANETTKMYTTAADSLGTLDQKVSLAKKNLTNGSQVF